jgi:NitT/TauT family transport system permease protein
VLLVGFSATFPVVVNTWTGVKAVKSIWIRAAETMGATDGQLFRKVFYRARSPTFSPDSGSAWRARGAC